MRTFFRTSVLAAAVALLATMMTTPVDAANARSDALLPPAAARVSVQLGGTYRPPAGVAVVERDRTDRSAPGLYNICYVNAFQAQTAETEWWLRRHPNLLLRRHGRTVIDKQWNEALLDTSTATKRAALLTIIGPWIDGCARSGYGAVDVDNLDSYTRSHDLLTASDALAFGRMLAARAHRDGLAIAQKNTANLSKAAHAAGFDFAIAEQCQVYDECGAYTAVYGSHVIEIEYTDRPATLFLAACHVRGRAVSITLRDPNLTPSGRAAHREKWCPAT